MADKEYIEREAVEKFITKGLNNPDKSKAYGYDAVEILSEVHHMDAADVVAVVRCKNCNFKHDPTRCALWYGEVNGTAYFIERGDEFYCSFGERRSDDETY